jgi:hypothetical protein
MTKQPWLTWLFAHRAAVRAAIEATTPALLNTTVVCGSLIVAALSVPGLATIVAVGAVLLLGMMVYVGLVVYELASVLDVPAQTAPSVAPPVAPPVTPNNTPPTPEHQTDTVERTQQKVASVLGVVPDAADLFVPLDENLLLRKRA